MSSPDSTFHPGSLVSARGREWIVLPDSRDDLLKLRPLGGSEKEARLIYLPLEKEAPRSATFPPPNPAMSAAQAAGLLMRDALRLKLRSGAGPFRSVGNLVFEPRAYQVVPLLMALRQEIIRLLIADDVGIGKTIEAGLILREMIDRGEIERATVVCPPHLCEQWQEELSEKFNIETVVVRTGTAGRLERGLPAGQSIFEVYPFTVVSLDYIKSERRRDEFIRACPEFLIVEEAHSCVGSAGTGRHLRYGLMRDLAEDKERHIVMLTATPHSGNDEAFHNLLGLLDEKFIALRELSEGRLRDQLRAELALHFVQRRRQDIPEWKEDVSLFPDRESKEETYTLTGDWGALFDLVLEYARGMVEKAEKKSHLEQRMNWWAALALLRCISSSPAAASVALRTRLSAVVGVSEEEQIEDIDIRGAETVLDGQSTDELNLDEAVPAGTTGDAESNEEDAEWLRGLIGQADSLRGPKNDPKLETLIDQVKKLIAEGFRPVVFCRYIATAHYLAEELGKVLPEKKTIVQSVTGELNPDERDEKVARLSKDGEEEGRIPVLVATDCLSEGINLQHQFNAVVHYDLVWNPTRHEQREGRVDRFGQASPTVRALMIYGANNPVDGAVLRVILRKAEKIRKELGVSVPMPSDNNAVMEAIMQTVLLQSGGIADASRQMRLDFGEVEEEVDRAWESAKEKAREGRQTVFAQRRLRPEEVLPEWHKTVEVLGAGEDVLRFVRIAAERLGAPLDRNEDHYRLPLEALKGGAAAQLAAAGFEGDIRFSISPKPPPGVTHIHRAHPLVICLADYVAEVALDEDNPEVAARCGVVFTDGVSARTTVYLIRLRHQINAEYVSGPKAGKRNDLLAEECIMLEQSGDEAPRLLSDTEALALMDLEPSRNIQSEQRERQLQRTLDGMEALQPVFEDHARQRAAELLEDHIRVREASRGSREAMRIRYDVTPSLPVDVIGIYLLLPTPKI